MTRGIRCRPPDAAVPVVREVGAMWQELSDSDKKRVGFVVVVLAAIAVMVLILAVMGYWVLAAIYTITVVNLAFLLYSKVIKPASLKRQPPATNPDTPE
jgi:hypothetical protein